MRSEARSSGARKGSPAGRLGNRSSSVGGALSSGAPPALDPIQATAKAIRWAGGRVDHDGVLSFREMPCRLQPEVLSHLRSRYGEVIAMLSRGRPQAGAHE